VKLADVRVRNPEDGNDGAVVLAAASVPLLNRALGKDGSADERATSLIRDDSSSAGAIGAFTSGAAEAGDGLAVCNFALASIAQTNRHGILTTVTVTGAWVTVTVTCAGHASPEATTRLASPVAASPGSDA
jgi:hypothetical protein